MKKLSILVCLIALVASNTVFAHATIGVFNLERALFETDAWKQELAGLEGVFQEEQETASSLRNEIAELQTNLEINAPTLTAIELQRIVEEGQFKRLQLQQIGERVQTALRSSQASFLDRYRQLLGDAVNEVYEEGGYDLILRSESVVISGFTYDITSEVLAKLNQFIIDLNR